jgi:hypothetical protein
MIVIKPRWTSPEMSGGPIQEIYTIPQFKGTQYMIGI